MRLGPALAGGAAAGLLATAGIFTVKRIWAATSTDAFCSRCHEMAPFFAAHAAGPHAEIPCRECHIGREPVPALAAKLRGLHFLAAHRDGRVPDRIEGVVPRSACTAGECHPEGGGDSLPWRGTRFHHSSHLRSGRSALAAELRCSHCHGLSREAGHGTAIREEACLLCHLAGGGLPEGGSGNDAACVTCHGLPPTVELGGGARLDHAEARARGFRCGECHDGLARDGLPVPAERCRECHGEGGECRLGSPGFRAAVHRRHGLLSSVRCAECHGIPTHHALSPWDPGFPAEGRRCPHAGGLTREGKPRAFVRTDCRFCHDEPGGGWPWRRSRCDLCHPER